MFARIAFTAVAAFVLFSTAPTSAQVVSCSQVAGLSATIPATANTYNSAGTVAMTYTWTNSSGVSSVSGSVPANASVTNTVVSWGPRETSDVTLSTACLQHGSSGLPVDFLANPYSVSTIFNTTSVAGAGPWIVKPVITAYSPSSVLQFVVTLSWSTPPPPAPAPLTISCSTAAGPARVGTFYSDTCSASGGTKPYIWSVLDHLWPQGLNAAKGEDVTISGTPAASGAFDYSVQVKDSSPKPQVLLREFSGVIPPSGIGSYDLLSTDDNVFPFDYDGSGKLDHLVLYRPGSGTIWILKHEEGQFTPVYAVGAPGNGIGGYDLASGNDRVFPFDYDGSGKLDHLVLYRPGSGTIWILKNTKGQFTPVYAAGAPGNGIGGYDLAASNDQVFPFDYDGSGKLDHLVLYRPGSGTIWILRNQGGQFTLVYAAGAPGNGIGGYDLASPSDRIVPFDYDGSGKLDHLVLYRPGSGTIWILKNTKGQFTPVYAAGAPGNGIGGYDLAASNDQVFPFDYDGSGKLDHLVLYRPGSGTIWILRNQNGQFTAVYAASAPGNGIGGYDLASPGDRIVPFDFEGTGKLDHLVLYRPGSGTIWILEHSGSAFSPVYTPK